MTTERPPNEETRAGSTPPAPLRPALRHPMVSLSSDEATRLRALLGELGTKAIRSATNVSAPSLLRAAAGAPVARRTVDVLRASLARHEPKQDATSERVLPRDRLRQRNQHLGELACVSPECLYTRETHRRCLHTRR